MHTLSVGHAMESLVCEFLVDQGLHCVCRNYRCRLGEIDLVLNDPASTTLVFVEVRYRADHKHGYAMESVDKPKQRKLRRAVLHYLQSFSNAKQKARIDVVGVGSMPVQHACGYGAGNGVSQHSIGKYHLLWIRNAF